MHGIPGLPSKVLLFLVIASSGERYLIMGAVVTVVCRHNQARSVMAAAALKRFFPDCDIYSAGIEAIDGQRVPQSILNLAESWGLEVLEVASHSIDSARSKLLASDFVVVAEDVFAPSIVSLGVAPEKILSMQDSRFGHELIPFDPIGHGNLVVSAELGKAIATTVQLIRAQKSESRKYPVQTVISKNEFDFEINLKQVWSQAINSNGVVIAADFRAPNITVVSQYSDPTFPLILNRTNGNIEYLDGQGFITLEHILNLQIPFAISGRFEIDQAEKFILSPQFGLLIKTLTEARPVWILAEPAGLGPCAHLVAAYTGSGYHQREIPPG